ncbi:MAG TPA: type VI secretion system baseplate subunit TssG, partial [Polyangiaceae bacterium]|nr:type VI secretion system baseplate subunit TssG [Polyangiaceae bacterium]
MAGPERFADPALIDRLAREGRRFEFFQAVALLERLLAPAAGVGAGASVEGELVSFRHDPQLGFHPSDVASIAFEPGPTGAPARAVVTTTFFGLTGSVSPLPTHMAEAVLEADASDEPSLRAFYDVFHHCLIGLFYRAWAKYRLQAHARADGSDGATGRLLALLGFDAAAKGEGEGAAPASFLGLAPLLALRSRSARSLEV